jgi:hypothetical protein
MMRKYTEKATRKKRLDIFRQIWRDSMEIFSFIIISLPHNNFAFILAVVVRLNGGKRRWKMLKRKTEKKFFVTFYDYLRLK